MSESIKILCEAVILNVMCNLLVEAQREPEKIKVIMDLKDRLLKEIAKLGETSV